MTGSTARHRPRVEGDREREILDAAVEVLVESGYDRLTMDAVAAAANASKATLYRRWSNKAVLVSTAISLVNGCATADKVDTGSLRDDLIETFGKERGGVPIAVVASLLTALHRHEELQQAFRTVFLSPRRKAVRGVYERALARGELDRDVDIELLTSVLPAMCIHHSLVLGMPVDRGFVAHLVDDVIMTAAQGPHRSGVPRIGG